MIGSVFGDGCLYVACADGSIMIYASPAKLSFLFMFLSASL